MNPEVAATDVVVENAPLRKPSSVVVCRAKQCAPANASMSREYVYNSLFHLLDNNNHKTALICEADPLSHICTENYVSMPLKVGVVNGQMYIDSVKITDVGLSKGNTRINLVLNYNISHNGQTPDCIPSKTLTYVKSVDSVVWEDAGFNCKMTTIGQTTIKTLFSIDYIDLDYGFIGGYYSIGASGPAFGGGTGYMLIRLPNDAYPLNPVLQSRTKTKAQNRAQPILDAMTPDIQSNKGINNDVQVFPVSK
ncbi:MAG: hypothetical protein LBL47_03890 [Lactobacillus sp.]|jgi:hypothetical protein|nr:hypothetical protein [Lactobacillus sp.]